MVQLLGLLNRLARAEEHLVRATCPSTRYSCLYHEIRVEADQRLFLRPVPSARLQSLHVISYNDATSVYQLTAHQESESDKHSHISRNRSSDGEYNEEEVASMVDWQPTIHLRTGGDD